MIGGGERLREREGVNRLIVIVIGGGDRCEV